MKEIYLVVLSLIGLVISVYIFYTKKSDKSLWCPIGKDCDVVVKSEYSKIFGIENTFFGILYYGMILIYALLIIFDRNLFKGIIVYYLVVSISGIAVLYSAYLTGVQAFILKKWCYYCITSAISSALIFLILVL